MKHKYSRKIFEKYSNIKLHANRPVEAKLLPVDRQTDGHADMTKLLVAFSNFANALKIIRNNTLPSFRKGFGHCKSDEEGSPIHIFTNTKLQQLHLLYSASSPLFREINNQLTTSEFVYILHVSYGTHRD